MGAYAARSVALALMLDVMPTAEAEASRARSDTEGWT